MTTSPDREDAFEALRRSVDALNENVRKDVSFGRGFALSVVRGIGYTLGAGIVASAVLLALAGVAERLEGLPVVGKYAEQWLDRDAPEQAPAR